MLSSVVGIIRGLMGSNWMTVALVVALTVAAITALVWARREQIQRAELSYQLLAEQSRHSVTRTELAAARAEAAALRAILERAEKAQAALQGSLAAALERERQASSAAAARKEILDNIRTRPRPSTEEVVDDATRGRVVDRLNRSL